MKNREFLCCCLLFLLAVIVFSDLSAVAVDSLKAPLKGMKEEVWSYMYIVKVAAVVVGGCFSVMKQTVTPLGVGAGITAGIHFFDKVVGDGSTALISLI
jgi:hypothetical protein